MFSSNILDTKVVDCEDKGDGAGFVSVEARCEFDWCIALLRHMCFEAFVSDEAGVGKTVHAFADFDINVAVVDERVKVVLLHDDFGNLLDGDAHVLVSGHGRTEVKVFEIDGHEFGVGGRYDAVE